MIEGPARVHPAAPGPSKPQVREARPRDLPTIVEIEQASYSTPWTEASLRGMIHQERTAFLVAEVKDAPRRLVGYGILRWAADEAEVANLAVHPSTRNLGIGGAILDRLLDLSFARGIRSVFLEVRASNVPALTLYRGRGFREVGVREHYYDRPREHARVLRLDEIERSPIDSPPIGTEPDPERP